MLHRTKISSLVLLCYSCYSFNGVDASIRYTTTTTTTTTTSAASRHGRLTSVSAKAAAAAAAVLTVRGGYNSDPPTGAYPPTDQEYPSTLDHEAFQDRIDAWKKNQQAQYSTENAAAGTVPPQSALRDAEGRVKLITQVSKGSRSLIFFLLLWRDVHLYEVADTTLTGMSRLLVVTPLCVLFLANLAGVVASITSPSHSAKKRLKAILNLDKLVEALLIGYNFMRLTVWPAKYIPREVYIANTLHSVFFLLQSQAFTRVTWDQIAEQQSYTDRPAPPPGYDGAPGSASSYQAASQHPTAYGGEYGGVEDEDAGYGGSGYQY